MSMQPANDGEKEILSPKTIATLIELNGIDFEMAHAKRALERRPKDLAARIRQVENQEKVVKIAKDTITAAQKRIDKKTMEIEGLAQDVLKLEGQLFSLKDNTEFNAMKSQIASRKKLDDDLQTEVLELFDAIDSLKEDHQKTIDKLDELKSNAKEAEAKVAEELKEQSAKVEEMAGRRVECLDALPATIRATYDVAFARRGQGTALVIDQICKGCDTQITLQTLSRVMAKKLVPCRNCQRILVLGE